MFAFMDRRGFLGKAVAGGALTLLAPALARAALLPANPVFGRSFQSPSGAEVALADYQDKPLLLNFWASWCAPCVREMPLLQQTHAEYDDLQIIGLAIDTKSNVQRFLQKVPVSYPVLLTGTTGIELMRELGNKSGVLPFTLFFKAGGRLQDSMVGELKPADLQSRILAIL